MHFVKNAYHSHKSCVESFWQQENMISLNLNVSLMEVNKKLNYLQSIPLLVQRHYILWYLCLTVAAKNGMKQTSNREIRCNMGYALLQAFESFLYGCVYRLASSGIRNWQKKSWERKQSSTYPCVMRELSGDGIFLLVIYVVDILVVADETECNDSRMMPFSRNYNGDIRI